MSLINLIYDRLIKIDWLMANVTVVGTPTHAGSDILGYFSIQAVFYGRGARL